METLLVVMEQDATPESDLVDDPRMRLILSVKKRKRRKCVVAVDATCCIYLFAWVQTLFCTFHDDQVHESSKFHRPVVDPDPQPFQIRWTQRNWRSCRLRLRPTGSVSNLCD